MDDRAFVEKTSQLVAFNGSPERGDRLAVAFV
jgi:hypothetical protein